MTSKSIGHWNKTAREEHASIAAFADLMTDLVDAGAPPGLILRANKAAADEVRHAQIAVTLAKQDDQSAPSKLKESIARWQRQKHLERMAIESFLDGCLNEGLAAESMASEINAEDPNQELLLSVVKDEREHAELGWSVFEWCLKELKPEVAARILGACVREVGSRKPADDVAEKVFSDAAKRLKEIPMSGAHSEAPR